jgi:hypothetical protein
LLPTAINTGYPDHPGRNRETPGVEPSDGKRFSGAELPLLPVVAVVSVVAVLIGLLSLSSGLSGGGLPRGATAITISPGRPVGREVPDGFLGFSLEYSAVPAYAGTDPAAVNPVFEQLIRNLTPGQRPVLRIGGKSADSTWWPVPGIARPAGVSYTLSSDWLQVTRALEQALGARVILGLNLEVDSPSLAAAEARALIDGSQPGSVMAFELGNEPELYGSFPWYRTPDGRAVRGRPRSYDFAAFMRDFAQFPAALPQVALAGPTSGGPGFLPRLDEFLAAEPRVRLVTVHRYPLQLCFTGRGSPAYPTVGHLLSRRASTGLADGFARAVASVHARGLPLRIDELNTVSCGADPAVSQTFASALWALDTLFAMARAGVDGVNIHTFPGAGYAVFSFSRAAGRWTASVAPEYYGLMMFAQAAPSGSRLLSISGRPGNQLRIWATQAPDRRIRVVLINAAMKRSRIVTVRVPGTQGAGTLESLRAPSAAARSGVELGGRSFGAQTDTGTLRGAARTISVTVTQGRYVVRLPAASAALLTLRSRPR